MGWSGLPQELAAMIEKVSQKLTGIVKARSLAQRRENEQRHLFFAPSPATEGGFG
jgi:hypothetical protein